LSTNHITMKLTDIDLSSLAEVAAAVSLLEHVHRELATGDTPLPTLPPAEGTTAALAEQLAETMRDARGLRTFVVNPAPAPVIADNIGRGNLTDVLDVDEAAYIERALAADTKKLRGLGVDPVTAQPMDAASVFGQSATPLPLPALSTAGVAPSPTAPAAPPASGLAPLVSQAPAPLPAVSADAPAAPAPQASPAGGVELDADGLPWDARIHAGTKRKNADGRWTAKKGIDDPDLVPRVVAQLRAQMAAGGVTALTQLQAANFAPPVQAQSATPLPAALVALAPVGAAHGASPLTSLADLPAGKPIPTTFADFMTAATVEVQSGRLTALQFGEACKLYGGPAGLATNPAAIPTVWESIKAQYPGVL
jgi:hypothetical protein